MERDCPAARAPGVPANSQPTGLFTSRGCRRLVRGLSPQKSGSASGERQGAWQGLRMTLGWGSRVLFPFLPTLSLCLWDLLAHTPRCGLEWWRKKLCVGWWGVEGSSGCLQLQERFPRTLGVGRNDRGGVNPDSKILRGWRWRNES